MEGNLDLTCVSFPPYVPYYPQVIAEASPWSMLTAIGTLSAVVVSVIFGLLGWIRSQKDRSELIGLRQEAAERETREAEAERRRVVGLVTAWITEEYRRDPRIEGYRRTVTLHIANESNEPMVNITANVSLGDRTRLIGPLSVPMPIVVLPPRRELTWDITTGVQAFEDNHSPLVELAFTDTDGRRWLRDVQGGLKENTGKGVVHFSDDDPSTALAQLGLPDPWRNPMVSAQEFVSALWQDPSEYDLEEFLVCLDPIAEGWKGEWTDQRVDELRATLSELQNLATLAWYASPEVAYARIFSDQSLRIVSEAGVGAPIHGAFITLVFREHLGWKVFAVGPRFTPDQIHFPEIDVEDD